MLCRYIVTEGACDLMWHVKVACIHVKNAINTPKIPHMSHPPHAFGSALAPRAYNRFIGKKILEYMIIHARLITHAHWKTHACLTKYRGKVLRQVP